MAYVQLPTRTTADTASSADVNQIQDNIDAILGTEAASGPAVTLPNKVTGPSSVTDGRVVAFDGTTGKLVKQDTRLASALVAGPSSAAADGNIALFDGTGGKTIKDSTYTIAQILRQGINTQTDSYTLALTDENKIVEMNKGSANTLTVPKNAVVAFPTGARVDIVQYGAGETTIAAVDGDVTIRSEGGALKINAQYGGATLYKRGTNEWVLFGSIKT